MNINDLPQITTNAYKMTTTAGSCADYGGKAIGYDYNQQAQAASFLDELRRTQQPFQQNFNAIKAPDKKPMAEKPQDQRRVVQVFIVDPSTSVPHEQAMLYKSEQKFTHLTDEELFFEVEMKPLLDKHNELRKTLLDKELTRKSGKETYLEPLRIRDLKMVVTTVAEF